ncbi:MAG: MFS transporter [Nocardioidaceae bacterium]
MRFLADLRQLLGGARFRQLFAVRLTSQAFDGVFQVGLASYVLFSPEEKPNATAIAAGLAALLLPFSILGPFVGVFLDRWRRRQVLVYANLVRLAPVAVIAVLIAADVKGAWLFVVVLLALSVNRFLLAGLSAALPHVVARRELVLANSLTPTSGTIAFTVGLGLASALRAVLPLEQPDVAVVLISGVGYLGAAILALRIPVDLLGPDRDNPTAPVRAALGNVVRGLVAGLRHLRERRSAAVALTVIAAHRFLYGLTAVMTVLLYRNYFHDSRDTDAALAGLAVAVLASGLGFLSAAVATPIATARMAPERWMVSLLALGAVVELMPGALFTEWGMLGAAFGLGLSAQGVKICVDTLVQVGVDDAFRGRVFSLYDVIFNVVFVAAAAVGALVIPTDGKSYGLVVCISLGYAITALGYAGVSRRLDVAPRR